MEKEINGKAYTIRELTYIEGIEMEGLDRTEKIKKMLILSCNLNEEDIIKLSLRDGIELQKVVNEVNGLNQSFQNPTIDEKEK